MDRLLIDYLPEFMRSLREFAALTNAEQPEFELFWDNIELAHKNMFFSLLTEYGLTRWETLLNLPSMAENNTFSHRQARIQARFNRSLPYTLKRLREMLDNLIGIDNYTLNLDCSNYLIYFRINLSLSKVMPEAADLLKKTVPANMFIDASLIYIENSQLTNFTHEFLSTYTHMQIREKEPLNV